METSTHKVLDFLEHLWPYISGMMLVLWASLRLLWYRMTHRFVTKDELHECREDVARVDNANLDKVYEEIKELTKDNAAQHKDIMEMIIKLHSNHRGDP